MGCTTHDLQVNHLSTNILRYPPNHLFHCYRLSIQSHAINAQFKFSSPLNDQRATLSKPAPMIWHAKNAILKSRPFAVSVADHSVDLIPRNQRTIPNLPNIERSAPPPCNPTPRSIRRNKSQISTRDFLPRPLLNPLFKLREWAYWFYCTFSQFQLCECGCLSLIVAVFKIIFFCLLHFKIK